MSHEEDVGGGAAWTLIFAILGLLAFYGVVGLFFRLIDWLH